MAREDVHLRLGRGDAPVELDPVATAGGLSTLAGIASVGWSFFDGMTAALAALALLGWVVGAKGSVPSLRHPLALAAMAASAGGWTLFLGLNGPADAARGLALGLSAGFVGWTGRRSGPFGAAP